MAVMEAAPFHRGPGDGPSHAAQHGETGPTHEILTISQPGMGPLAAPLVAAAATAAASHDLQSGHSTLAAMKTGAGHTSRRQLSGPVGGRDVIPETTTEQERQLAGGVHAVAGLSISAARGMLMGGLGVGVPKHGR